MIRISKKRVQILFGNYLITIIPPQGIGFAIGGWGTKKNQTQFIWTVIILFVRIHLHWCSSGHDLDYKSPVGPVG